MPGAGPPRGRGVAALALALLAVGALAAPAGALTVRAGRSDVGWVGLRVHGARNARVTLAEQVGDRLVPLAPLRLTGSAAVRRHAARWRCARRLRRFVATAPGPGGAALTARAAVRTPSCAHRLRVLGRPVAPRAGGRFAVRVTDRWGVGLLDATLCARAPGAAEPRCRVVTLPRGRAHRAFAVRATRPGHWRIEVRTAGGGRFRAGVHVRRRGAPLRVLATGDSMIQIIDFDLRARLAGRAQVRSDAHVGTGVSKPFQLDWVAHAARSARSYRPDVTVVNLGANEGFPIGAARCCGRAWTRAYARRVRAMMLSYSRRGEGMVYWLTLPAPRRAAFRRVFAPVDTAIRRAAASLPGRVHLIDTVPIFTPGFRYRSTLCRHHRCRTVRQADGVHFDTTGAAIVARLVERAMRADGVL